MTIKLYGGLDTIINNGVLVKIEKRTEQELQDWRDGKIKGYEQDAIQIMNALSEYCCVMTIIHLRDLLIKGGV